MIFALVSAVFVSGSAVRLTNRVLEEVVIPRLENRALRKRRQAQADAGIPEEKQEVLHHIKLSLALEEGEFKKLKKMGALDILSRGSNRLIQIRQGEEN